MKYKTFSRIGKTLLIGIPVIVYMSVLRSCISCMSDSVEQAKQREIQQSAAALKDTVPTVPESKHDSDETVVTADQREILELQKEPLSTGKPDGKGSLKRFMTKGDYKIDMRCDKTKGFKIWNRIKVDLNSNKKYDEKWNFRNDGSVSRFIAPNDDEDYTLEYRLRNDVWELKK